jgi:hypothetical protein
MGSYAVLALRTGGSSPGPTYTVQSGDGDKVAQRCEGVSEKNSGEARGPTPTVDDRTAVPARRAVCLCGGLGLVAGTGERVKNPPIPSV